jgi:hypothetical protein
MGTGVGVGTGVGLAHPAKNKISTSPKAIGLPVRHKLFMVTLLLIFCSMPIQTGLSRYTSDYLKTYD